MISWEEFKERGDFTVHPLTDAELEELCSEEFLNRSKDMGKHGILLPHHILLSDLYELLYIYEIASTNEDLYLDFKKEFEVLSKEEFFNLIKCIEIFDLYKKHDYFYYNSLKSRVIDFLDTHTISKTAYFTQCCGAFESKLFYPCICGLFALFEGLLGGVTGSNVPNIKKLFQELISKRRDDGVYTYEIANIQGFIETITASSNFNSKESASQLNRHWILHGRSNREIGELDCLMLFNAIDAIIDVINIVGDPM